MKEKLLGTLLISSMFIGGYAGIASAAGNDSESELNATTDVEITLEKDSGSEENDGIFKDTLAIVYKPTAFKFSGVAQKASGINLENKNPLKNEQFVVVNDDRKDSEGKLTLADWKLSAQLSKIVDVTDSTKEMAANLIINPTAPQKYDIGTNEAAGAGGETTFDPAAIIPTTELASAKYSHNTQVSLGAGEADTVEIMSANKTAAVEGDPNGVMTNTGNASLDILAGSAQMGSYSGTITWTLEPGTPLN